MNDTQTMTVASVTLGKRWPYSREVPIRNVVQEYFNAQAGRMEWRLIYGLSDGVTGGFKIFLSGEEALAALKEFGPLDVTGDQDTLKEIISKGREQ
jgi:hypothetical protein